jgi:NAD(P)-dependent dehydrogenase (short-subunit alcohol dehydrogenase family)
MNCNLFGALSLFQACLPSMRARGDGRLIFVA